MLNLLALAVGCGDILFTLTLYRSKEFPMKIDTVEPGWPIVYIDGRGVIFFTFICIFSLNIDLPLEKK